MLAQQIRLEEAGPEHQACCGVPRMVTVLKVLASPLQTPRYAPYRTFTQDNIHDAHTEAMLPRTVRLKRVMTLDEQGRLAHAIRSKRGPTMPPKAPWRRIGRPPCGIWARKERRSSSLPAGA
jgi:Phytochelatin synthase